MNETRTPHKEASIPATPFELALLGILAFEPSSGYDIKKMFEETSMRIFSSSPGAIYPALARLERRGWLRSDMETSGAARPRRVYTLRPAGRGVLESWLRERVTVDELRQALPTALLRFSFMELVLDRAETVAYLEGFREAAETYRAELRAESDGLDFDLPYVHPRLAMEHGVASVEATLHWIDSAIDELKSAEEAPAGFGDLHASVE